jgi:hypothetical protein
LGGLTKIIPKPAPTNHHFPTITFQPSTINLRLPTFQPLTFQPSTFNLPTFKPSNLQTFNLPTFNLPIFNLQPSNPQDMMDNAVVYGD